MVHLYCLLILISLSLEAGIKKLAFGPQHSLVVDLVFQTSPLRGFCFMENQDVELLSCWDDGIFYVEEFRPVVGHEGLYEVSSFGRIKSLNFNGTKQERILKPRWDGHGYYLVHLYKDKIRVNVKIHRLVALAFVPNPEDKGTVNHRKGMKTDNRFFMLEWATQSENNKEAFRIGLRDNKGEKQSRVKLTEAQVLEIRAKIGMKLQKEIGAEYGVSKHAISAISRRKNWSHI